MSTAKAEAEIVKYVGFKRTQDEYGGAWSMAKYIEAVETADESLRTELMGKIFVYNAEDLAATWAVYRHGADRGNPSPPPTAQPQ